MIDPENDIPLGLSEAKQRAIVGHALMNNKFFLDIKDRIQPDWISADVVAELLYKAKVDFYKEFNRCPSIDEIYDYKPIRLAEPQIRAKVQSVYGICTVKAQDFGLDALQAELTDWLKSRIFKKAVLEAGKYYNNGNNDRAFKIMSEAVRTLESAVFEKDTEELFEDFKNEFDKLEEEYNDALGTGLTVFDKLLTPQASKGSLLRGDTSIVLAPVNMGKSTSLLTTVAHNLLQKKHVLWLTHEGRIADLKMKLWCNILKKTPNELLGYYKTKEGFELMEFIVKNVITPYLTYIPMNQAGLPVEEVISSIRKKQDKLCAKTGGKGYDLLVNDYPACLTANSMAKLPQKRELDDYIYGYFVNIALELNFHSLLAIQANREGSRVNQGQREDRLLTKEDVQESWGPIARATNVWTINRGPLARAKKILTYYIEKSRSSETGIAIVCRTDFARCKTHSDELGAAYYRGTATYAEIIDGLLTTYNGTEIDQSKLLGV